MTVRIFQLTRKPFLCDMILGKQEVDDVISNIIVLYIYVLLIIFDFVMTISKRINTII